MDILLSILETLIRTYLAELEDSAAEQNIQCQGSG